MCSTLGKLMYGLVMLWQFLFNDIPLVTCHFSVGICFITLVALSTCLTRSYKKKKKKGKEQIREKNKKKKRKKNVNKKKKRKKKTRRKNRLLMIAIWIVIFSLKRLPHPSPSHAHCLPPFPIAVFSWGYMCIWLLFSFSFFYFLNYCFFYRFFFFYVFLILLNTYTKHYPATQPPPLNQFLVFPTGESVIHSCFINASSDVQLTPSDLYWLSLILAGQIVQFTKISCMNVVNVADWKEILFNMFCLLVSLLLAVRKQERVYKMSICLMFITFPYCPWFNPADISRFKWLWWHYNYLHSICKPGSKNLIFMFIPFWAVLV